MCGIVGYLGDGDCKKIIIDGLKELEYRGYDSAGISILTSSESYIKKAVGKIVNLEKICEEIRIDENSLSSCIGHTRWATHGKPTSQNAHPHTSDNSYVVHNGIIENYLKIKKNLESLGHKFTSQTDTEVIVHLYEENFKETKDEFKAFEKTVKILKGSFAILLITKTKRDTVFFAKNETPMIISTKEKKTYFSSSDCALIGKVDNAIYLEDMQYGYVNKNGVNIFEDGKEVKADIKELGQDKLVARKDGFRYFMEKEIYEQSQIVCDTLLGRIKDNKIYFSELDKDLFLDIEKIVIIACGTSYHSALSARYLIEDIAKVQTLVEVASEFRYKKVLDYKNTLFISISQSGETADTLECIKIIASTKAKTISICNVDNSSIVRISDYSILTRAGKEKGVASTKAFCTQVIVLWMMALNIAQDKNTISKEDLQVDIDALLSLHSVLKIDDALHERVKRLSKRYLHGHGFFFIGRDIFYPLALEGALKLKEISYLHAEGYPAGEMKHGPIALADSELFTIALLPRNRLYDKMKNNINELSARDSTICVISDEFIDSADDFIQIPNYSHYMKEYFYMMIAMQLLSMEIAIKLDNDVDMPRNLAKSVTVE